MSLSTSLLTLTTVVNAGSGLASSPTYSFTSDTDSGMFLNATGDVRLIAAGSTAGVPAQIVVQDTGTNGDLTFFARGTGDIDFYHNFVQKFFISGTAITGTVPFLGANGSNTAPTYSFSSDSGNGMYLSGTDTLGFATNGLLRVSLNTVALISTVPSYGPDGSNSAPTYSFSSDSGNGMYLSAADTVGIAANGNLRFSVFDAGVQYHGTAAASNADWSALASTFGLANIQMGDGTTGSGNTGLMRLYHYFDSLLFPADKILNLGRTAKLHAGEAAGNGVGDKIGLYGTATNSNRFGLGIQSNQIVAYTGSTGGLSVVSAASSGHASSGTLGAFVSCLGYFRGLDSGGTNTSPSFSWLTDTNTGMYNVASDTIGFSAGGTLEASITTTGMNVVDAITIATDHDVQVMDWMSCFP